MTTALDIIKGALRRINSYMSGEQIANPDSADVRIVLNDMLDSWSADKATVYASVETVVNFVSGIYQYTIGPGGAFATDVITGAAIPRPVRIGVNAFTRLSGIDYPFDITMDQGQYTQLGLKNIPSPWPYVGYYNPTFPLGTLYVYPAPAGTGEFHFFPDQILSEFATLTTPVNLPQGYVRALKWGLAKEICAEYGYLVQGAIPPAINQMAKESLDMVKSLNQVPMAQANLDSALLGMRHRGDASWILHGGFTS